MNTRRRMLIALAAGALGAPLLTFAQQQRKVYRIGYLANNMDPHAPTPTYKAFVGALRELGWIEGKNIEIRVKSSGGREDLFPQLAAEMVRENLDVIVTGGSPSTRAAKAATNTIPIVFGSAASPVEQKFVASLARPGGNVTGLAVMVQELGPKRLQLLKEILPHASRFARLYQANSNVVSQRAIMNEDDAAARALGVTLQHIAVTSPEDIENAFAAAVRNRIDAINVKADGLLNFNRGLIARLGLQHRMPVMGADDRLAEAGALVSYGENFPARYRRAAFLVDKILRGTKPAEIPVEQPAIFELVINLTTAKALDIKIPQSILVQADRMLT